MTHKKVGFMKVKLQAYGIVLLTSLGGSKIIPSQVANVLELIQAISAQNGLDPNKSMSLSSIGSLSYEQLKSSLQSLSIPLSEAMGQPAAQGAVNDFSFLYAGTLGFAFPETTWKNAALPLLYAQLEAIPGFNLQSGVTFVMLAFDNNNKLITDLTKYPNFTGLNFYLFAYNGQGVSLVPAGMPVPIATMGNIFGKATTLSSNNVAIELNDVAVAEKNQVTKYPASLTIAPNISWLATLSYAQLKTVVSLSEVTVQGDLDTTDTFSFLYGDALGFAFPQTTWKNAALPQLYTTLQATTGFNLASGVTFVMLASDENGGFVKDLTKYSSFSGLNFYLFAYNAQGVSLVPQGIPVPVSTMGNIFNSAKSISNNIVNVVFNEGSTVEVNQNVPYPASLVVAPTAPGSQSNTYKPGSSAIKPNPQSQTININPNNNLPLYPGKLKTAAITSPITDITLYPSTNVGDLYTSFRFNGAILDSVNAAIAQGKSLMFGLNVAQNNNSYDITGTIYDLQQNVIASETRTKVTNRAAAGTPNAQNIPVGSPITVPAIFEYYNIGIQQQGSSIPLSFEGLSLSSQVILAASVKSIPLTSPIQSLQVTCPSSDSSVSVIESLSAQNLLDINAYLATNNNLNLMVSLEQNAQGNYDFSCIAYAANGQVVARECRCSVTNHNPNATATSTVPLNAPIPFAAATFTGANVAILLLDTQDLLTIENISLASQITLAPQQISAASVVELPAGVSSVTSMNMIAQFGSLATEPLAFQLNALNSINSALAAGQAVSIQCDVQNGQIMTGAYNFTTSQLIAAAPYAVPAGMTAGDFSGYELQYVLNSQVAGAGTSSTSKTIQCNGSSAVTLAPQVVPVKVQSFYMAGPNGDMSFANNPASLAAINSSPQNVYNKNMPVSIAGGLTAINNIRVLLTDANTTTFLAFDFTKAAGLANITQDILNNGLYVCCSIEANTPASGQFSAVVTLQDAQGNIYAYGATPITTQMITGSVLFNMQNSSSQATSTATLVQNIQLALQQSVLYRQQAITTPAQ